MSAEPVDPEPDEGGSAFELLHRLITMARGGATTTLSPDDVGRLEFAASVLEATAEHPVPAGLVVDELAAYVELATKADLMLAKAKSMGPGPARVAVRDEAHVWAVLAVAAAAAALVQQGVARDGLRGGR